MLTNEAIEILLAGSTPKPLLDTCSLGESSSEKHVSLQHSLEDTSQEDGRVHIIAESSLSEYF